MCCPRVLAGFLLAGIVSCPTNNLAFSEEPSKFSQAPAQWAEACPSVLGKSCAELTLTWPERVWWLKFQDPILAEYIQKAIADNHDLKASYYRVLQAKANVRIALAQQLPTVGIGFNAFRFGLSKNQQQNIGFFNTDSLSFFAVPLSVAYEPDIWLKHWDHTTSERKVFHSKEWDYRTAEILLASEVATAYFNMVRDDATYELREKHVANLKEIWDLKQSLFESGLAPYEDVTEAERDYARAEIELHSLRERRAIFAHELMVLTGEPPKAIESVLRARIEKIQLPCQFDIGIPAALIVRRPDIQSQEALLEKARIDVRIARKEFLPTIKLNGLFGFAAENVGGIADGDSFFSLLYGTANQPIFRGGKEYANLSLKKAKQKEQIEHYRQTILNAFKDVEDSIKKLRTAYEKWDSNAQEKEADEENYRLVSSLYQSGLRSRLDQVEAENLTLYYRITEASLKMDIAISNVSLYKALGGGY
jgi:NodT family efflux transporter outer membrane factor (OMF) lipoprotein